jgi:hypothetical protein
MPKLKKAHFSVTNKAGGAEQLDIEIMISSTLTGMAKISKQIQEATFNTEKLLEVITTQQVGLLPNLVVKNIKSD